MHDLFFQRYQALKSEDVKAQEPQQMRPKEHHYRESICAGTEQGDKLW